MPDHECAHCERPGTQRCSGCKDPNAWYCGPDCQRKCWPLHIFHCNPTKPISTAYYIAQAVIQDRFPDHEQALEDYGFTRAFSTENRSKLLGLYQGLFRYLDVAPKDVHRWRVRGILVQEIKAAFQNIPEANRGGYYPWFLKNQWVLDPMQEAPDLGRDWMLQGWRYAIGDPTSNPPDDHMTATIRGWPDDKRICNELCMTSLCNTHPPPELGQRSWIYFGFCTCKDEWAESRLGIIYEGVVKQCTFDELLAAYRASSLIALMDKCGFRTNREPITHLEDVLSHAGVKSVWWLKFFVLVNPDERLEPEPAVIVDYGFMNCKQPQEWEDLKAIYKKFFESGNGDPIALHNATVAGKIFEYVGGFVKLKKKFRRLMKNPYPLPTEQSFPEIAN